MKKAICLMLLAFASMSAQAGSSANYFDQFSAQKIKDSLYVIHGPREFPTEANRGFMNNPAFIVAEKSVVVVDPGSSLETGNMVLREIRKVTDKPVSHVFNTHIHGDHWLANDAIKRAYPNVRIIADQRMITKAKAGEAQLWADRLSNLTNGVTKDTQIVYPDTATANGKTVKAAGLTFKMYSFGIDHSGTDIMIEYVEGDTLFTGDNVGYERILGMNDGSFRDLVKVLDLAISLNRQTYVPGHGDTGDVSIVKMQRKYYDTLYKEVSKYYEEGLEDFEMKPKVEAALAEFKDWSNFSAELGKHISLAKLEAEKAEFE